MEVIKMKAAAMMGIGLGLAAVLQMGNMSNQMKENRDDEKEEHEELKKMIEDLQAQMAQLNSNKGTTQNSSLQIQNINSNGTDPSQMLNEMMQQLQSMQRNSGYQAPSYMASSYAA
jgi:prefoldin subunit 5